MTDVRLACGGPPEVILTGFPQRPDPPALLISYVWLEEFNSIRDRMCFRDWVLDSGAYTAFIKGKHIDLDEYIRKCKELLDTDPTLKEVYALDVIGDWKGTLRNTEKMWKAGVPAIPTYHVGEPDHVLKTIAREYPKIAVGGAAGRLFGKERLHFMEQCFARVWPKRIHGFGTNSRKICEAVPFDSCDASNWSVNPGRFGWWLAFGMQRLRHKGDTNFKTEVDWYTRYERRLKAKWEKVLAQLPNQDPESKYKAKLDGIPEGYRCR